MKKAQCFASSTDVFKTFSIIVPTVGRTALLLRALRSIVAQSQSDWECIVINDEPTMKEMIASIVFAMHDQRIRILHNEQNNGVAMSRNAGIAQSCGRYIAFLDDDDYWLPNHLDGILSAYLATDETIVVYTNYIQRWQDDVVAPRATAAKSSPRDAARGLLDGSYNIISMSTVSIPRCCLANVGIFDEHLKTGQDWDIYLRLSKCYRFVQIEQYSAVYFHHFKDRLTSNYDKRMESLLLIINKWQLNKAFVHEKVSNWKYMALDSMLLASYKDNGKAKCKALAYYFSFPRPLQSPFMLLRLLAMAALPFKVYSAISRVCRQIRKSNHDIVACDNDIFLFDQYPDV